ncbi:hypothetical protein cyc_02281 [Cyclospora cayetanensis]|uniref:Uncharacterized protein n=1 Tax=Cyclospora cayetanensis TaxID=88456 RepID=A0A1D3D5D9_9EIME|nr:hypothetical protein cyc_02281 [Cyclospora cayetanensis]
MSPSGSAHLSPNEDYHSSPRAGLSSSGMHTRFRSNSASRLPQRQGVPRHASHLRSTMGAAVSPIGAPPAEAAAWALAASAADAGPEEPQTSVVLEDVNRLRQTQQKHLYRQKLKEQQSKFARQQQMLQLQEQERHQSGSAQQRQREAPALTAMDIESQHIPLLQQLAVPVEEEVVVASGNSHDSNGSGIRAWLGGRSLDDYILHLMKQGLAPMSRFTAAGEMQYQSFLAAQIAERQQTEAAELQRNLTRYHMGLSNGIAPFVACYPTAEDEKEIVAPPSAAPAVYGGRSAPQHSNVTCPPQQHVMQQERAPQQKPMQQGQQPASRNAEAFCFSSVTVHGAASTAVIEQSQCWGSV